MFIEKEDLYTAICEYQLQNITTSAVTIRMAILAAIDEARSYLNAKYDCEAIFSATGEDRHATLLEHCKNIAVWNLCGDRLAREGCGPEGYRQAPRTRFAAAQDRRRRGPHHCPDG